jgi:protein-tyrosine phosphatase
MPFSTPSHLDRLPLDSLFNTRDLGGVPLASGGFTTYRHFLRSDETAKISDADISRLMEYPVNLVIDLRTASEIRQLPSRFADIAGIRYVNISLLGDDLGKGMADIRPLNPKYPETTLSDFYIHMLLHYGQDIGRAFNLMAEQSDGALLFHCAHGKDRTGLVAALLLKLAGASDLDIIENYAVSYELLLPWFQTFWHEIPEHVKPFFNTDRENMEETLAFINRNYTDVPQFLAANGVSIEAMARLRNRLTIG